MLGKIEIKKIIKNKVYAENGSSLIAERMLSKEKRF
jgi:hypothetical protein